MRLVQGHENVRLLFRLRTGLTGLWGDLERLVERCVMGESGVGEDVSHILVGFGEFERDRLVLLDDMVELWGSESGWMNFGEWTRRKSWHFCWEKGGGHM